MKAFITSNSLTGEEHQQENLNGSDTFKKMNNTKAKIYKDIKNGYFNLKHFK